jgi:hypothetical protein
MIVDDSEDPIFKVVWPASMSVEEIEGAMRQLSRAVQGDTGPVGLLLDATAVRPAGVTALHRRAVAEGIHRLRRDHPRRTYANAIVLSSTLVRALATGIMWLTSPTGETRFFSTQREARSFLRDFIATSSPSDRSRGP